MAPDPAESVSFSEHALDRYRQRARPGIGHHRARLELQAIVGHGSIGARPSWLRRHELLDGGAYLVIGDLAFPLTAQERPSTWIATTCIARGSLSSFARHKRTLRRRAERRRSGDLMDSPSR